MEKKKFRTLEVLQIFVVCVLFALKLIPQLQYTYAGSTWSLLYQVIFILWLLLTVARSGVWFQKLRGYFVYVFLWLVVLAIEFLIFPNTQIGFLGLNLTFWEPLIMYYYYSEICDNPRIAQTIAIIAVAMLFFGIVQSIQTVNVNSLAAREASSGNRSDDAILTGNYSFTATLTILIPLCFGIIVTKQKAVIRVIAGLFIGLSAYFIFHCNLMISIVSLLFSFVILFIFSEEKGISGKRVFIFIIALLLFFMTSFYWRELAINLLTALKAAINTNLINERIDNLIFLLRGTIVGNVSSRINLDFLALNTFITHPIFGIGPQNNADIYFLKQLGLHATFFDDLARYGIIGFGIMAAAYLNFFKDQMNKLNRTMGAKTYKAGFAMYILISMLNPTLSANVGIALFFIYPTLNNMLFMNEGTVS